MTVQTSAVTPVGVGGQNCGDPGPVTAGAAREKLPHFMEGGPTCRRCHSGISRRGPTGPMPLYCSAGCRRAWDLAHRRERHALTCERCARSFRSAARGQRFCSNACATSARARLKFERRACATCARRFTPKRRRQLCCSPRCGTIRGRRTQLDRAGHREQRPTCPHCRATFTPKYPRYATYCSRACAFAARRGKPSRARAGIPSSAREVATEAGLVPPVSVVATDEARGGAAA
jgi:hypothetical protein